MTFRVLTNGTRFRVQHRYWFWPFWVTECRYTEFSWYYDEWETREAALEWIDKQCQKAEQNAQRWVPL